MAVPSRANWTMLPCALPSCIYSPWNCINLPAMPIYFCNLKKPPQEPTFTLLPKIVNGGIAALIGVSVVFPLDLVKTRLQNQKPGPDGVKPYNNMLDCFLKSYIRDGYFGMYRGSAVNIALVVPEKAVKLAANDMFRFYLTLPDGSLSLARQMVAGGAAGAYQALVTTPMELLKIQLQIAGEKAAIDKAAGKPVKNVTALGLTKALLKKDGFFGLYKGFSVTLGRDIVFSLLYFPLYATLSDLGPRNKGENSPPTWWSFLCGCLSGCVSAVAVTPFDVIKTRMQLSKRGSLHDYSSVFDCVFKTLKFEGVAAFFKGASCRMIVIAPLYGIVQAVYYFEIAERYLGIL